MSATTEKGPATCPCGSGRAAEACCLPYIEGKAKPPTAESLMRARYAAFALGKVDFIVDTHHSKTRKEVTVEGVREWSQRAQWLGFEIQETRGGGEGDQRGEVRFLARYREKGNIVNHLEDALFEREDGAWRFVTGSNPPSRRVEPKVGRNDPCPCGSGKKHKRCCGVA